LTFSIACNLLLHVDLYGDKLGYPSSRKNINCGCLRTNSWGSNQQHN